MVLSRLTKITGPGIRTDTNWVGNNANYTGILTASSLGGIGNITATGIITASSFSGDGSGLIGVASTDNIITGTAATFNTYPVDINAGMTVAGVATFAGNVSIAGTLTYEDVTNIDSVGLVTARTGFVSPYADIDDFVDIGSNIQLGNAGVITATTFKGNGDFVELDVDGHTNLDNVSIAGVTTIANDTEFKIGSNANNKLPFKIKQDTGGGNVNYIDSRFTYFRSHAIRMYDQDNTSHQVAYFWNNQIGLYASNVETLRVAGSGVNILNGDLTVGRDIDVDGHTNLDNVSIAGVTTAAGILDATNTPASIRVAQDIQHKGDADTKISFSAADTISMYNAGSERLRITPNGIINIGDGVGNEYLNSTLKLRKDQNSVTRLTIRNEHSGGGSAAAFQMGAYGNSWMLQCGSTANDSNAFTIRVDGTSNSNTGTERFRLTTAGAIGLNGANYGSSGQVLTSQGSSSAPTWTTVSGTTINNNTDNYVITGTGTANTLRGESGVVITSDSELIVGMTAGSGATPDARLQVRGDVHTKSKIQVLATHNDDNPASLQISKSRSGGNTILGDNDDIGQINFAGNDGNGYHNVGRIMVSSSGEGNGNDDLPSMMRFFTTGNGSVSLTERMRLNSNGRLHLRPSNTFYTMNPQSTDLVIGDGGSGRGITLWTAAAADNQTISFQTNETLSRAEGEISYGPTATSTVTDRNAMMFRTNSAERLRITSTGRFGFNRSAPHYAMHLSPAAGETRIDLHMTNDTTGHNAGDGVQFGYQNGAGAYIWNFENTPIYFGQNNIKKFEIHATGSTQIYKGDLLLGPDNVSQMEATIRAWGCSLWYTTIDTDYYHDSGGEFRVFYNKGSFRGDNYLTCYNCAIESGVGPQNRVFWKGGANNSRAEGTLDIGVGYRGAWFFISRTSAFVVRNGVSGKYLFDRGSTRSSVSFDSFGNNIDTGELSFHCGSSAGYNSGNSTIGGRLGSSNSDTTLRMYAVGVNMENYNAPNSKKAGNHLGVSVINEDGTDYTNVASRLSENLINNSTTGGTNSASGEFNWGNRHSNDRGYDSGMQFSQLLYFDDVQLNSAQWDYLEHYFKVMYGNG